MIENADSEEIFCDIDFDGTRADTLNIFCSISREKMPMNLVENYGSSSGASIPVVTAMNLRDKLLEGKIDCCMSAFGSGLAWGVIIMKLGVMDHCEIIESNL